MKHVVVKCLCAVIVFAGLSGLGGCSGDDAANGGAGKGGGGSDGAGNGGGSAGTTGTDTAGTTGAAGGGAGSSGHGAAGAAGSSAGGGAGNDEDGGIGDVDSGMVIETGVSTAAIDTCKDQCDVQEGVAACQPILQVGACKTICSSLSDQTPSTCDAEFKAFYDCSVADGFRCILGTVAQKTSACSDEHDALDTCRNGGVVPMCEGANSVSGKCPSVACACTSGTVHVAGFTTSPDGCTCYTTTTCKDFWCPE